MWDESLQKLISLYDVGPLLTGGVLLVDDEPANLMVLSEFLSEAYTVHEAESAAEALEIAERVPLDVIISDQRMPNMTGVELLERIKASKPDIAGIVLTGFTDTPALVAAINAARIFRYLRKPWNADEIERALHEATEHVAQDRAIRRLVDLLARRTTELAETLEAVRRMQGQLLHLERLGTMGRLASGIVHDLRNVMTGLVFLEYEAVSRDLPVDMVETVTVGLAGMRNLLGTLESMNEFARSSRLSTMLEYVEAAAVLRDAVTVMRLDKLFKTHTVTIDVQPDLPTLLADRHKLVQGLVNLLRNALHATEEGRHVWLSALIEEGTGHVILRVDDEGLGVPPDLRSQLFTPFVSTKGDKGLGLGLYMARLVADTHGGVVRCLDRPGGGARFEIVLPTVAAPQSVQTEAEAGHGT